MCTKILIILRWEFFKALFCIKILRYMYTYVYDFKNNLIWLEIFWNIYVDLLGSDRKIKKSEFYIKLIWHRKFEIFSCWLVKPNKKSPDNFYTDVT